MYPALNDNLGLVAMWTVGFEAIYYISALLSSQFSFYKKLNKQQQFNWNIHWVSMIHALLAVLLVGPIMFDPIHRSNKVLAHSPKSEKFFAISTGYFLWDVYQCLRYFKINGAAFTFHAFVGLFLMIGVYSPMFQYYAAVFLLFEVSTIFLNIHWFCDKLGLTGSLLQIVNGICLMLAFFGVRICFGSYKIVELIYMGWTELDNISTKWYAFYVFATFTMQSLNFYWFSALLKSFMKRLNGS